MNTVERIKALCKERKIAISRLEKECGFANGYISGLRKGTLPDDRLRIVAEYLNVTPTFLSTGEENAELTIEFDIQKVTEAIEKSVRQEIIRKNHEGNENRYYADPETAKLAQEALEDSDMRILLSAKKDLRPEDFRMIMNMIRHFKESNRDG